MVQGLWVDGSNDWVNGSNADVVSLYKHLTGCPEAIMAHDMCRSLIGFYLGSKCRFVFRALFL